MYYKHRSFDLGFLKCRKTVNSRQLGQTAIIFLLLFLMTTGFNNVMEMEALAIVQPIAIVLAITDKLKVVRHKVTITYKS